MKQITKLQHFIELTAPLVQSNSITHITPAFIEQITISWSVIYALTAVSVQAGTILFPPVSAKGIFLPFLGKIEQYRRDQDNGAISVQ